MPNSQKDEQILAVDWGDAKIGLAIARKNSLTSEPYLTLPNNSSFHKRFAEIISLENISLVIFGLPRNILGQATPQTNRIILKAKEIMSGFPGLKYVFQDEFLSSKRAIDIIQTSKKYNLSDEDRLAASLILDDYLQTEGN